MVTNLQAPTATKLIRPLWEFDAKTGTLRYRFHPGQTKAWESEAREILILAGSQGGKTEFAILWLHREIHTRGPGDYIVVTATYPLLQLKLLPAFLKLFHETPIKSTSGKWRESDKVYEFDDGQTRVFFCSAANPESIESATAKAAVLDEAGQHQFHREANEAVNRRLARYQGRKLYATTPYEMGWLKTEVMDRAGPGSGIEVVNFPSYWNPAFPPEEYVRQARLLPRWKHRMFYDGVFEKPVGLVYDAFDEMVCKIAPLAIPASWHILVGHDFGSAHPAAVFFAQDPNSGQLYLWKTYKPQHGASAAEHVALWRGMTEGKLVLKRVGGSHQEEQIRELYRAHGWPIQEPRFDRVEPAIMHCYGLFKRNRVFVFSDQHDFLDELLSYSYKLDDKYQPMTGEIEDKARYHLMDAMRYILPEIESDVAVKQDGEIIVVDRLAQAHRDPWWDPMMGKEGGDILVRQRY